MRLRLGARCPAAAIASLCVLASASKADPPAFGTDTSATPSRADTLVYGVDVGVAESDNVSLVSTNKVSQTMAIADGDFDVKQQSRLLDVDAKGNFTYLDYLQGAYGGQLIGRFDGSAHLALIPDRLVWVVQDDFGQAALDAYTPQTPTNLENVNYLSTGPDFALRFGASSYVNMSARYARTDYQTSPYNSNRLLGDLAWGYQLSARSSVSLNGETERVLFANTVVNSDFDRSSGFVRYEVKGARTELSADLGATTISQYGRTTRPLAKVSLARKLSAAAKLTLTAGRDLTDAGTSFSGLQSGAIGLVGTAPAAQTTDNYTSSYASASWQYTRNRTLIALSARWEKDIYDNAPVTGVSLTGVPPTVAPLAGAPVIGSASALDYTLSGAEFRVERKMTRALTAEILGRIYKTDYLHSSVTGQLGTPNYNTEQVSAGLTWRHGRALEVKLRYEHNAQVTTGIYGYGENRVILTVGYRPKGRGPENDPGALSPGN
jgi:hypothetical protein